MGVVVLTDSFEANDSYLAKWIATTVDAGYATTVVSRTADVSVERDTTAEGIPVVAVPRGDVVAQINVSPGFDPAAPMAFRTAHSMREATQRREARTGRRRSSRRTPESPELADGPDGRPAQESPSLWGGIRTRADEVVDRLDQRLLDLRERQFMRARASRLDAQGVGYVSALARAGGSRARLWRADPRIRESVGDYRAVLTDLAPDLIVATSLETLAAAAIVGQELAHRPQIVYCCRALDSASARRSDASRRLKRSAEEYFIPSCDRIVATSDQLARTLQSEFELDETPAIVLDAPGPLDEPTSRGTLRESLALGTDVPLLVHTGPLGKSSGLNVAVTALTSLPEAHLAICLARPSDPFLKAALGLAGRLGVRERVHPVFAASTADLAAAARGADVGLIPVNRAPVHDEPQFRKLMEFVIAGVPVVVSDCASIAGTVDGDELGEVFHARDAESLAAAVLRVLGNPEAYAATAAVKASMSWAAQGVVLIGIYRSMLGQPVAVPQPARGPGSEQTGFVGAPASRQPGLAPVKDPDRPVRLFVGPANMAGQGWAWARAVEAASADVTTTVVTMDRGDGQLTFPSDVYLSAEDRQASILTESVARIAADYTHALFESGLSPLGETTNLDSVAQAYQQAADAGLEVALVFHGSEIRDPQAHLDRFDDSIFRAYSEAELQVLIARVERARLAVELLRLPTFVSTPDLLSALPSARLLPIVVDVPAMAAAGSRREILSDALPVVLHAPSSARVAGSDHTDEVLRRLDAEGTITYRRLPRTPPEDFPEALADADIIVDKLQLVYGVTATQAMAAGRVVVGWSGPETREHVPDLPLVDADRSNLREVITGLAKDHDRIRDVALAGQAFARERHDGRASAQALAGFLGSPAASAGQPA